MVPALVPIPTCPTFWEATISNSRIATEMFARNELSHTSRSARTAQTVANQSPDTISINLASSTRQH